MSDDLTTAWTSDPLPLKYDMEKIRARAARFDRGFRRRNRIEFGAAALVAVCFTMAALLLGPVLSRIGAAIEVMASMLIAGVLWRYGSQPALPPSEAPVTVYIDAYRNGLLSQSRLLGAAPLWYCLPLGGGLALITLGLDPGWQASGEPSTGFYRQFAACSGFLVLVAALNLYAAWGLRRDARALAAV